MSSEVDQKEVKKVYGDSFVKGEIRFRILEFERREDLFQARRLWPEEKNVSKLLRKYGELTGKPMVRFCTKGLKVVLPPLVLVDKKKYEDWKYRQLTGKEKPPLNMSEAEKEMYLDRTTMIGDRLPKRPCPECKKGRMKLSPMCGSCPDSDRHLHKRFWYRTKWRCEKCGYIVRSRKSLGTWVKELGKDR